MSELEGSPGLQGVAAGAAVGSPAGLLPAPAAAVQIAIADPFAADHDSQLEGSNNSGSVRQADAVIPPASDIGRSAPPPASAQPGAVRTKSRKMRGKTTPAPSPPRLEKVRLRGTAAACLPGAVMY